MSILISIEISGIYNQIWFQLVKLSTEWTQEKIILINISGIARGKGEAPPSRNPGKFAKDGEKFTFQPAMRIDSRRKFKVLSKFRRFLLKFSLKCQKF